MTKGERMRKDVLALATPPMWAVIPRCREAGPSTYLCHLVMLHAQNVLHQMVGLADELHVTILYPIMHHLHKVSCSLLSHLSVTNTKRPSEKQLIHQKSPRQILRQGALLIQKITNAKQIFTVF